MSAYFITGTGTDIGKTWLSCALLRLWREQGRQVHACKPVQSGFDLARPAASDAGLLLLAQGLEVTADAIARIAPWCFAAPLSPDMAAAHEGRTIDFAALVSFTRQACNAVPLAGKFSEILIEGVGGVMVPLDDRHTVCDWIAAAELPTIVVTGSYLGSLSHTLTALVALEKVGAGVTALVVNESADSPVALDDTLATLRKHAPGIRIIGIARKDQLAGLQALAELL